MTNRLPPTPGFMSSTPRPNERRGTGAGCDEIKALRTQLAENEVAMKAFKAQRDAAVAQNSRWRAAYVRLTNAVEFADNGEGCYVADSALMREFDAIAESTPEQSLVRLKALTEIACRIKVWENANANISECPTEQQLTSICFSMRHDYGLMGPAARSSLRDKASNWWRAIAKELNEPSQHPMVTAAAQEPPQ